ncbi:DNA-directed RNA polymerase subunit beta [Forsythia ovata]|uniref:DNA-directed RNA polymerase subunit beta n=1 Tax=Forsythia ovata TaxID=205694 RepID=A0ABD1T7I6_9LAMI
METVDTVEGGGPSSLSEEFTNGTSTMDIDNRHFDDSDSDVNDIGEIVFEPSHDSSKMRDDDWRYASLKFGNVVLEQLTFWAGEKFAAESSKEFPKMYLRHARL